MTSPIGASRTGCLSAVRHASRRPELRLLSTCVDALTTYKVDASPWEPVFEGGQPPDIAWLQRVVDFISAQGLLNRITYVHCLPGMNRSGAVVTAYLMQRNGWGRNEALAYLQKRRPQVQPNPELPRLLAQREEELKRKQVPR